MPDIETGQNFYLPLRSREDSSEAQSFYPRAPYSIAKAYLKKIRAQSRGLEGGEGKQRGEGGGEESGGEGRRGPEVEAGAARARGKGIAQGEAWVSNHVPITLKIFPPRINNEERRRRRNNKIPVWVIDKIEGRVRENFKIIREKYPNSSPFYLFNRWKAIVRREKNAYFRSQSEKEIRFSSQMAKINPLIKLLKELRRKKRDHRKIMIFAKNTGMGEWVKGKISQ